MYFEKEAAGYCIIQVLSSTALMSSAISEAWLLPGSSVLPLSVEKRKSQSTWPVHSQNCVGWKGPLRSLQLPRLLEED